MARCISADVAVIGGGVGGCAAALAAAEAGCRVVLTEETIWIGGQLTSQAVPPDEHGWIERFGRTASYQRFRELVRAYYRTYYPLTPQALQDPRLNPGNGWVSPLCHEPRVALAVLEAMLAPHRTAGRLAVLTGHAPAGARLASPETIESVTLTDTRTGESCEVKASLFLDATETGELLVLTATEYVTGQESRAQTGEPSAPAEAQPENVQAFSWCFIMGHHAGENHVGPPPRDYHFWLNYRATLTPPWPGPWLSWRGLNPRTMQPVRYHFNPHGEQPALMNGLWSYRRILDRDQFVPGAFTSDLVAVNWPMIDYLSSNLLAASGMIRRKAVEESRQLSLAVFHWMQTEAPRPDGGTGWPGLRLRGDVAGTPDGLAMAPYIRESRRLSAVCTVREQDVAEKLRPNDHLGERYEDSVGVGYYRIDLHPSTGGDNYIDVASLPFRIPLGALLPVRMENLLAAAKNIGTTHITNGCYRLHPIEWNIGESVGTLAAFCLGHGCRPRAVHRNGDRRRAFQERLLQRGVELAWPENLDLTEGDPHAHVRRS